MNTESVIGWIDGRIEQMFKTPRMWGSDEVLEMQVLLLLEMRAVVLRQDTPGDVRDAYVDYLSRTYPKTPNRPLFQIVESDDLGFKIVSELRKAVAALAPDCLSPA